MADTIRAAEQNNSIFGHANNGRKEELMDTRPPMPAPPRFTGLADTPQERLVNVLQEALDLAGGMDPCLVANTSPASESCSALGKATETADWEALHAQGKTMFKFSNAWTTDVVEAKTLAMFAYMVRARRVLEVGMFTGYGALTIAEVLPHDGKVVTCEIDPFLKEWTKPFFARSPHGHKVDVRLGPALETINAYDAAAEGGFDMVFIDADKGGYQAYYEACLSRPGLLNEGGVIVVDNVLFKGQSYLARQSASRDYASWNDGGSALAKFNKFVRDDPRVEQVMLPVRDGITIVRRVLPDAGRPALPAATTHAAPVSFPAVNGHADIVPPAVAAAKAVATTPSTDIVMSGVGGKSVLERMRLERKVALVTGGGQGIGRAYCHALGEAGASVMVVDMEIARAEAVAAELTAKGIEAAACRANVAQEKDVEAMVAATVARFGGLHIAVNNAGINKNSAAEETPVAEWDATFAVNTRGVFMCCQHEARHMLKAGGGKIINTASMASLIVPHPQKQAAYNASKSAVVKLTQSVACEWASRGVIVNCISPGIVDTPLIWDNPALKPLAEKWIDDMPIGRLCKVTDIQAAIVYLASEASDYMVGHNLVIEGGQSLW